MVRTSAAVALGCLAAGLGAGLAGVCESGRRDCAKDKMIDETSTLLQLKGHGHMTGARPSRLGHKCISDLCCALIGHASCVDGKCACEEGYFTSRGWCKENKKPLAWCGSGGGLRATAAAQGYANAFKAAGLYDYKEFAAIAAVSGAGWWLSQFAYDEEYFLKNSEQNVADFDAWLNDIWKNIDLGAPPNPAKPQDLLPQGQLLWAMFVVANRTFPPQNLASARSLFLSPAVANNFDYIWRKLVRKVFSKESVANKPALASTRQGLKTPSLHFAVSGMLSFFINGSKPSPPTVSWGLDAAGQPLALDGNPNCGLSPMQYVVPGVRQIQELAGLRYPRTDAMSIKKQGSSNDYTLVPFALNRSSIASQMPSQNQIGAFSVEQVASMTSSTNARVNSPIVSAQMLNFSSGFDSAKLEEFYAQFPDPVKDGIQEWPFTIGDYFRGVGPMNQTGQATCGNPTDSADLCHYPSPIYADGAFTDSFGAALTLADLQRRYGTTQPLHMVLSDNAKIDWGTKNLRGYFESGAGAPGSFIPRFNGEIAPSPQVFEETFSSLNWTNLTTPATPLGFCTVKYSTIRATTVDNPAFGVRPGQMVNLLMFLLSADVEELFYPPSSYISVAKCAADQTVADTLKTWLGAIGTSV